MTDNPNQPENGTQAEASSAHLDADSPEAFDAVESLLRLIVGGAIEAPVELVERLQTWEASAQQEQITGISATESDERDRLRYALVGLAFETQNQVRESTSRLLQLLNTSSDALIRNTQPLTSSRVFRPFQSRFNRLASLGEGRVNSWIARGQTEEPQSRAVAREALGGTIDEVIDHLAENPEIRNLVTQQGVGIAGEIVDGVRSRTVTADTLLERLARGVLKRPPREQLPPPSPEVMSHADQLRDMAEEEDG